MRVLHLFNWPLKDIIPILDEVAYQGFDAIQINPIQPLKDENSNQWWMSYQPIDFDIGNKFGSEDDLRHLCTVAENYNVKIIVDLVCNHLAGKDDGSLYPHENVKDYLKNRSDFWKEPKHIYDWDNRYEVINYCLGLPGLNLANQDLQRIILHFIERLIDCGIGGIRFDAAKSIALPKEGNDFWLKIFNEFNNYDLVKYGEVIFEETGVIKEYCKYIKVMTDKWGFDSEKIFNFVESHDSYLDFGYTKDISTVEINNKYKDLSSINANTLYYARPFDDSWKEPIVKEANYIKVKR